MSTSLLLPLPFSLSLFLLPRHENERRTVRLLRCIGLISRVNLLQRLPPVDVEVTWRCWCWPGSSGGLYRGKTRPPAAPEPASDLDLAQRQRQQRQQRQGGGGGRNIIRGGISGISIGDSGCDCIGRCWCWGERQGSILNSQQIPCWRRRSRCYAYPRGVWRVK